MSFDNVQADFFGDDLSAWDFDFTGQSWGCDDDELSDILASWGCGDDELEKLIADLAGHDELSDILASWDDTPL